MSEQSGGFLSRWQLRRQQVEAEAKAEAQPVVESAEPIEPVAETSVELEMSPATDNSVDVEAVESTEPQDPNRVLTAADLPDPDSIEVGGSFAQFMANNVDPAAKAAALRALWKQPHFSELDGMVEYGLDYHKQPLMTAEESAEVARKLFNNVKDTVEKVLDATEPELASETAINHTNIVNNTPEISADKLGEQETELVQSGSVVDDKTDKPVA